jgi:uncharacterized protein (UPF0333 family)
MKKLLKEEKAQTAIEYLLIIGGAIGVATIVGLYLKSIPRSREEDVNEYVTKIVEK